jgi:hypothetical protein
LSVPQGKLSTITEKDFATASSARRYSQWPMKE